MNLIADALAWWNRGYTPLPVKPGGSKAPAVSSWKQHQHARPDAATVVAWFTTGPGADTDGLGLVCGGASGGLVMIEFEGRAVTEGLVDAAAQAFADHDAIALWERVTAGYTERTPSGGLHLYVRVPVGTVPGNTRLARRPSTPDELAAHPGQRVQVLIETRGQGGFTVIAPSAGRTHPTGKAWEVVAGTPDTIPALSQDDLELALAVLSTLDQMPAASADMETAHNRTQPKNGGVRPGDDYNSRATWTDILTPRGWTLAWRRGRLHGWTRPGKHPRDGISATTGRNDADNLYVFSSSTEFECETPYDKFGAYALLEHGGNIAVAAKALAEAGYGSAPAPDPDPVRVEDLIDRSASAVTHPSNVVPIRRETVPAAVSGVTQGSSAVAVDEATVAPDAQVTHLDLARYGATEDGLARALVDRHAHELRYCPQRASWLAWDGARWQWDEGGHHRESIKALARHLPDNDAWKNHRKKMLSSAGVAGVAKMASTAQPVVVHAHQLDTDPWALNTPGGIVDLRTGDIRAASPDDLCTRLTKVSVDRRRPERWLAFLTETFDGDTEMVGYIQRLAGYSASGVQLEHVLPFLHGSGGNGKSVFLEVLVAVLGDYASTAPPDFLLATGRQDEAAVARLAGLRLVACSEVNQRARFDEAKVKLLTGGDRLTARFLYGNHFTFLPTHHLWLMGNHQPSVEAGGESFWRRLRLLPFTRQVPKGKRVEGLAGQLVEAEGPRILGWIVAGAIEALANKLREPEAVMAATASYAEEEDALGRFVADRVMLATGARTATVDVRAAYAAWCRAEGVQELNQTAFGRELRSRWGIDVARSNGRRHYVGLTLYADLDEPESDDPRDTPWDQR